MYPSQNVQFSPGTPTRVFQASRVDLGSPNPRQHRRAPSAGYTSVNRMSPEERLYIMRDTNTVDIYTRTEPTMAWELANTRIAKMMLETFSVHALEFIQLRHTWSPSTALSAAHRIPPQRPNERGRDNSNFVWEITGVDAFSVQLLVRYMINSCNPAHNYTGPLTAVIACRNLDCWQWMRLFDAAHKLRIGAAENKLMLQLGDELEECSFTDALSCWQYASELKFNGVVTARFADRVKSYIRNGPGLGLEELKLLWGTGFEEEAKADAAHWAAERCVHTWEEEDDWTLQELPEACWWIMEQVWQKEAVRRGH